MLTEELQGKINFVKDLSDAITNNLKSIKNISYEVFKNQKYNYHQEYLKIDYDGGAFAIRNCNGNSKTAIFEEINKLLNGGYYDEVSDYNRLLNNSDFIKLN